MEIPHKSGARDMASFEERLTQILNVYANCLQQKESALAKHQQYLVRLGEGLSAVRQGACQVHLRADARPVSGRGRGLVGTKPSHRHGEKRRSVPIARLNGAEVINALRYGVGRKLPGQVGANCSNPFGHCQHRFKARLALPTVIPVSLNGPRQRGERSASTVAATHETPILAMQKLITT
jgi:hypothetical protein